MRRRKHSLVALAVVSALSAAGLARAQTATWDNTGGSWDTSHWLWSPSGSGFPNDFSLNAVINGGGVDIGAGVAISIGSVTFTGGTLSGLGSLTVGTDFNQSNGNLTLNNLTIQGNGTWSGGNWNNGALVTMAAGSTFLITGGQMDMANRAVVNNGTVSVDASTIRGGSTGSSIDNNGLWLQTGATTYNSAFGGNGMAFNNNAAGTLRQTANVSSNYNCTFNNTGLVDVKAGTLSISGGGTSGNGAEFKTSVGAVLQFTGNHTLSGVVNFTGAGKSQWAGGTMFGDQTIKGTLAWVGGDWNSANTTTIHSTGTLLLDASVSGNNDAPNRTIINNGTIEHNSGSFRGGSSGTLVTNNNLWLENSAGDTVINSAFGGNGLTFNNVPGGIFRKTSAGTTSIIGVLFNNSGLVDNQAGTLNFNTQGQGQALDGGEFRAAGGARTQFISAYTLSGTVSFTGAGTNAWSGGNLSGNHAIKGKLLWDGGTWNSGGTTEIRSDGTLYIAAGNNDAANRTIVNNGTIEHNSGSFRGGSSGTLVTNNSLWLENSAGDTVINSAFGGNGLTFDNVLGGIFRKTSAGTTSIDSVAFNNAGLVDNQSGVLNFNTAGNGQALDGGEFRTATGARTQFVAAYTLSGTVSFTGAGTNAWSGGNLSGNHAIKGKLLWDGGTWNSGGTTEIRSDGTLYIAAGNNDAANRTIVNNGTIEHNSGSFRGGSSGTLVTNNSLWLENSAGDTVLNSDFGGNGLTFNNAANGIFRKTSAGVTTIQAVAFNNAGLVDNRSGTLTFATAGRGQATNGAEFRTGTGAVTQFINAYTFTDTVSFTGSGSNQWAGGTLSGTHTILGTLEWSGGNWASAGTSTIGAGATLNITNGAADLPNGRTITNNGTVNHPSGSVRGGGTGSVINNAGIWIDGSSQSTTFDSVFGGNGMVYNNLAVGTFVHNSTQTVTTFSGVPVNNAGLIDAQAGTINFNAGLTQTAGKTQVSGGTIGASSISVSGGFIAGNGTFSSPITFIGGDLAPGFSAGLLTIAGNLTLGGTSAYDVEIYGLARGVDGGYDAVNAPTVVLSGGQLKVLPFTPAGLALGSTFNILNYQQSLSGTFLGLAQGSTFFGGPVEFSIDYGTGVGPGSVILTVTQIVPEPSALALVPMVAAGLVRRRRTA